MMKVMVISGLLALAMILPVSATIINVPGDSATIQGGINGASSGDTVLVASGIYIENITIDSNISLGSLFLTTGDTSYISSTIIVEKHEWNRVLNFAWENKLKITAMSFFPKFADKKIPFAPREEVLEQDEAKWKFLIEK